MKDMKYVLLAFLIFLVFPFSIWSQSANTQDKFEIIYLADGKYASDTLWLKEMRDDWKATGINLRIFRSGVERFDGRLNWNNYPYEVDDALEKIADAGLNIYIRINLALLDIQEVNKTYNDDNFQIRSNGERFLNQYDIHKRPLLNLTSVKSRIDMLFFVWEVVNHLNTFPDKIRNKIKLIVPTFSMDDETELPFNTYDSSTKSVVNNVLTGFSRPEISAFMKFLKNRYSTIDSLNKSWGERADFTNFDSSQINIRKYKWDGIKSNPGSPDYYIYENGRKDFLDFRRAELKRFIDDCSSIVKKAGFNFGVQFGSIYDGLIEFRGFYDPTPLIENVDELITDDIPEYYPNFPFSADYSRSLCKYWDWKNKSKKQIVFATEINWPGYNDHSPNDLIKYWSLQLRTFYKKGASCLFVSQWGTLGGPNNIADKIISGYQFSEYSTWQDTLEGYRNSPIKEVNNNTAFNLSCEMALNSGKDMDVTFAHNKGIVIDKIEDQNVVVFPLYILSKFKGQNTGGSNIYQDSGDFVTDYMIQKSPEYIKENYKNFYLTGTSRFMPKAINNEFR